MKDGVIADFEISEAMLRYFIEKVDKRKLVPPRVVIAVPSGITAVEKRAVKDSAIRAGAREVLLLGEPMAASIGAGLPIHDEYANMIVDIGGGTTEVAIISISGVSFQRSIRVGGDELDEAIVAYMKRAYGLLIGERTAEEIKFTVGSAAPLDSGELSMDVRGRDSTAGLPNTIHITSQEIREEALKDVVQQITDLVKNALDRCQPEHSADLIDRGIVLAGGGALIRGLDQVISDATGLTVIQAEDPLSCVANGTGEFLNLLDSLSREQIDRIVTHSFILKLAAPKDRPRIGPFAILGLFLLGWIFIPFGWKIIIQSSFDEFQAPFGKLPREFRSLRLLGSSNRLQKNSD